MPTAKKHHGHHNHSHTSTHQNGAYADEEVMVRQSSGVARFFFGVLFTIAQLFLFGAVVLFVYWVIQHDRGFSWQNDRAKQFNLHAVLMIIGFIFLNGQAMLIYKSFQCCKKIYNKIMHAIIFVLSISAITIGLLIAIQGQQNVPPNATAKHFYSIHSWTGLVTIGLFALQFMVGFVSFLVLLCCEKATASYRARLLPTHITFGLIIYALAVVTCLTGLLQTARQRLGGKDGKPDYKDLTEPGIIINAVGCCMIGLLIIIPYIIRNYNQRRHHGSFNIN